MIERVLERLHTVPHALSRDAGSVAGVPGKTSDGEYGGGNSGGHVGTGMLSGGSVECILSMGYKPDRFRQAYPDGIISDVKVSYAIEPEPLGTGGAIRFAAAHGRVDRTFVVMNGDVLGGPDIGDLLSFHFANRRHGALATIGLVAVEDPSRFGVVVMDASGQVQRFVEKPPQGQSPSRLVNSGVYIMEPEVLDMIPGDRMVSIERETFPALAGMGALYAYASHDYWLDAGTPEAYIQANMDYLSRYYPAVLSPAGSSGTTGPGEPWGSGGNEVPAAGGVSPLQGARRMAEGVWVTGNPTINGKVQPPSLVLDGSMIESGAEVSYAVIGNGCFVGAGCRVERSVVMDGSKIMQGSLVSDSVLAENVEVGAGSRVSDWSVVGDGYIVTPGSVLHHARIPELR
jgi:mannose-1-phosphate guanylyltransferase